MASTNPYVLIVGYRQQLAHVLHRLEIPYSIWSEKELLARPKGVDQLHIASIPQRQDNLIQILKALKFARTPTHVIPGTESAVLPAAIMRRFLGARQSAKSVLMRCTDKVAMKLFLRRYGVPMADFSVDAEGLTARQLIEKLALPVVVKNRRDSGSRNIVIAEDEQTLRRSMSRYRLYEAFIQAEEGSVESFIQNGQILFTNITDYYQKKHVNLLPAHIPDKVREEILDLNRMVIAAMNIKWGMTHLEFYRTENAILFGEVALRPPGGYIMELLKLSYQFDPWEAYVKVELGLDLDLPQTARRFSACHILHPGKGKIISVNSPQVADYRCLKKSKLKAGLGSEISERQGVGEDIGYLLLASSNYQKLLEDLERLKENPVYIVES